MAEELLGEKVTPTILKYLMLISTFAAGLVGIVSYYAAGQEGTVTGDFLNFFASVNFALMAMSAIELTFLRKRLSTFRVAFGAFVEFFRAAVYLNLPINVKMFMNEAGDTQYDSYVGNNLGMQVVGVLGIVTLAALVVSHFAYDRLMALREKVAINNAFNAVPAIVLILAYAASMGIFREALIGPRHQDDIATPAFDWTESLFSQYSTIIPGWDASDLLQSYLNQFLAGLNNTQREIMRYRDDQHPNGNGGAADQNFFRTESLSEYYYNTSTETSAFSQIEGTGGIQSYGTGTPISTNPASPDNVFTIKYNITYSGSQWSGYIPTCWDTTTGNYVFGPNYSPSTYAMKLFETDGTTEVDSSSYSIALVEESTAAVPRAVKATVTFGSSSSGYESVYLVYNVPYVTFNVASRYIQALPPSDLYTLSGYDFTEINDRFLQWPDTFPTLATYTITGTSDQEQYWSWVNYSMTIAPDLNEALSPQAWLQEVIQNDSLDAPTTSALSRAAYVANRMANQFSFDWDMWTSEYTDAALGDLGGVGIGGGEGDRLGPETGEDFVGWMFNRGTVHPNGTSAPAGKRWGGTGAHFSTSLCMMLREMGIPARTVFGYIGTNTDSSTEAVVTALYTHSWVEALIPLDTDSPLDGNADTAEWMIFDSNPLSAGFYELPSNAGTTKETYNVTLELRNSTTNAQIPSSTPIYKSNDPLDNITIYVRVTSTTGGTTTGKPNANVTLGFEKLGSGGTVVADYKLISTNQTTDSNGELTYTFMYNSSSVATYGAGLARITAYINNTMTGSPGNWITGTPINGTVFSAAYDWRPVSSAAGSAGSIRGLPSIAQEKAGEMDMGLRETNYAAISNSISQSEIAKAFSREFSSRMR
ncbi:MAG: transglutaminase family protein [Candidatus Heimdallarchaeota archaeon]